MKTIILCDLDGTLADTTHRQHFIHWSGKGDEEGNWKPDWDSFFKACVDDTPIEPNIEVVLALDNSSYDYELWIVTGRSESVHEETVCWLSEEAVYPTHLIMRPEGDFTSDVELKKRWLNDGTIPKDKVKCVFEDRSSVVKMWRNEGLTCYQVAEGDF